MSVIHYRLAKQSDNEQLIALTSATDMTGTMSLRIDRNPDFFRLLHKRGESKVFIALDNNIIVGSLSVSVQNVYVGGEVMPLHYVGDFKVAEAYRHKTIGANLCNELARYMRSIDADLAFLNVSYGNKRPFSFFKGRPDFPDFDNIGLFTIHQFIGIKQKQRPGPFPIEPADITDDLIAVLNAQYARYELGNVITKDMLKGTDIFIIRDENRIRAAMCLADTMNTKQNVLTRLPLKLKYLLRILNACRGVLGISKMPSLHTPIRILYIKYIAASSNEKKLIRSMLHLARNIGYERKCSFVSIGLHEKDPINACFSGLFKLTFRSVGMLISLKNNRDLIRKVIMGIPFEDYSLV